MADLAELRLLLYKSQVTGWIERVKTRQEIPEERRIAQDDQRRNPSNETGKGTE
jgi:hypothetical protein